MRGYKGQYCRKNGFSLADLCVLLLVLLIYEVVKQLLVEMVVEKIRGRRCCGYCRKRQKAKVVHLVGMDAKVHVKRTCYRLKNTKRPVRTLELCGSCADAELEEA